MTGHTSWCTRHRGMCMEEMERFRVKKLREKLKKEIQEYEQRMLEKDSEEVYYRAYEIDCMNGIYGCLFQMCGGLDAGTLWCLQEVPGLLACLYQGWLKYGDSQESELRSCIEAEIEKLGSKNIPGTEKT